MDTADTTFRPDDQGASCLSPDYWTGLLGRPVAACRVQRLTGGNSASLVRRVHLKGDSVPPSVIVKDNLGPWPTSEGDGLRREAWVYTELLAGAAAVAPALLAWQEAPDAVRLVLEDLQPAFALRCRHHRWSAAEVAAAGAVFARLHAATRGAPALRADPPLMAAPDRRWAAGRLAEAAGRLDAAAADLGRSWDFQRQLDGARRRDPVDTGETCLVHSDFNAGNFAVDGDDGRLLDWHIAAAASPAFELGNYFFQPHGNHRHVDPDLLLDAYEAEAARLGSGPWHTGSRTVAFAYGVVWCALSYLPALAGRAAGEGLSGWWLHTADAAHENLTRFLQELP